MSVSSSVLAEAFDLAPHLKRLARREIPAELRSKMDPSDIFQELLLDLSKNGAVPSFTSTQDRRHWLIRAFLNNLMDCFRSFRDTAKRDIGCEIPADVNSFASRADRASERLHSIERKESLERILATLPDHYAILLRWRFLEGLTYSQIASRTHRTEDGVRMALNRAIRAASSSVCFSASAQSL